MKSSTPYYVHVKVKNTGEHEPRRRRAPRSSSTTGPTCCSRRRGSPASFTPCPSQPLPEKFTQGKKANLCLVYLAANKTKLEAIAMRPTEQTEPITWTGKITKPAAAKKG